MDTQARRSGTALLGTEEATLDSKGRLLFSKKKRDRLGEPFFIGLDGRGCLVAYPEATVDRLFAEIEDSQILNEGREEFSMLLAGKMEDDIHFDKQGRVVIPQRLRDEAGLEKDVVLVGAVDRVYIWPRDKYEDHKAQLSGKAGSSRAEQMNWARDRMKEGA